MKSINFILHHVHTLGYRFEFVLFENWHSLLIPQCVCDFELHVDWMIFVSLAFLKVDVVNSSVPVNIRPPF